MAAMARRRRHDATSADDIEQARQRLIKRWSAFTIACDDRRLNQAAQLLQLEVSP